MSIRNLATSAALGSTGILAAATDPFVAAASRRLAGLPVVRGFGGILKRFASDGDRKAMARRAMIWDDYLHTMNESARFVDQMFGHEWSRYLVDRSLTWNALSPLTDARKRLEATAWHETLGGLAEKDTDWIDLNPLLQRAMEGFGITPDDWHKMRAGVDDMGFLDPGGVFEKTGDRMLAEKYAELIQQWQERSVPAGDPRIKSVLTGKVERGTILGEIAEFGSQFMSFGIPRQLRQSGILVGNGGDVYGPFDFKIFDPADVVVFACAANELRFTEVAGVTVTKVNGNTALNPLDAFTVKFPFIVPVSTRYVVLSSRVAARAAGVMSGTRINPDALEKEFSKIATQQQELRRDVGRAVMVEFGDNAMVIDAGLRDGDTLMKQGGRFTAGPNLPDLAESLIAEAAAEADRAKLEADRSDLHANRSRREADRAAGYVNDIVSEKELPITATRNGMEALQFPAGMNSLETRGYAAMGDGGGAQYRLAVSEPAHGLKVQSQDGSWWEVVTNGGVNVAIAGAFPGADVTARIQVIADYLALKGGGEIQFTQPGTYTISSVNLYGKTSVFVGDGVTLQHKADATTAMFLAQGSKSGVQLPIAATVSADATSLQLVDASSISAGDWIILKDTTDYSTDSGAIGYKSGESLVVKSKTGNALFFDRKIFGSFQKDRDYTTARGAHVEKVTPLKDVRVYGPGAIMGHMNANIGPLEFRYVDRATVEGVKVTNFGGCGLLFRTCRNIVAMPRYVAYGRNETDSGFPGYGVALWGACDVVYVAEIFGTQTRHLFTTMGSADGGSSRIRVSHNNVFENDFTALDTHEGVHEITFSDNKINGGNAAKGAGGIYTRAPTTRIIDNDVIGVPGRGIGAGGQALRSLLIQGGLVEGSGEAGIGIGASCRGLRIFDVTVIRSGSHGIFAMGGGPNEDIASTIAIAECKVSGFGLAVADRSGINLSTAFASVVYVEHSTIEAVGGSAARGIYIAGGLVSGKASRNIVRGTYSINAIQVPSAMDGMDNEIEGVPTKLNVAIPDDGVYFLKGASSTHVQYTISAAGSGSSLPNGIFTARTNSVPQCFGITSFGANVSFVAGAVLTGTTGTDGSMTISATSTGVYIENRTGGSATMNISVAPSLRR